MESFYNNILLNPYFKIKGWTYRSILKTLVKNSSILILFLQIPPNFEENENFEILR